MDLPQNGPACDRPCALVIERCDRPPVEPDARDRPCAARVPRLRGRGRGLALSQDQPDRCRPCTLDALSRAAGTPYRLTAQLVIVVEADIHASSGTHLCLVNAPRVPARIRYHQ